MLAKGTMNPRVECLFTTFTYFLFNTFETNDRKYDLEGSCFMLYATTYTLNFFNIGNVDFFGTFFQFLENYEI